MKVLDLRLLSLNSNCGRNDDKCDVFTDRCREVPHSWFRRTLEAEFEINSSTIVEFERRPANFGQNQSSKRAEHIRRRRYETVTTPLNTQMPTRLQGTLKNPAKAAICRTVGCNDCLPRMPSREQRHHQNRHAGNTRKEDALKKLVGISYTRDRPIEFFCVENGLTISWVNFCVRKMTRKLDYLLPVILLLSSRTSTKTITRLCAWIRFAPTLCQNSVSSVNKGQVRSFLRRQMSPPARRRVLNSFRYSRYAKCALQSLDEAEGKMLRRWRANLEKMSAFADHDPPLS